MKIPKNIKDIKNIFNENNKTKLIGLLTILILLWLVLYLIPELFASLFTTLLGNLILLVIVLLVTMNNRLYGLILAIIFIIIYRMLSFKEGFVWSTDSTQDFLQIQNTINRNIIFDVNMIQTNQASQEEVNYFNENGMWPWSQSTIDIYKEAISRNPYIRTYYRDSVDYMRSIYNEAAILRILSYQTKEGQFLINGVLIKDPSGNPYEDLPSGFGNFGYNSGLITNKSDDLIKCNVSSTNSALERITYTGKGGILGEQTKKITPVDYTDLENIIPGFKFVNEPCNPCGSLNESPDNSCKFTLNAKIKHY